MRIESIEEIIQKYIDIEQENADNSRVLGDIHSALTYDHTLNILKNMKYEIESI